MRIPCDNSGLDEIPQSRKTGEEPFLNATHLQEFTLLQFWQWSASDVVSNATRGRLAEFIVAQALGVASGIRNEWDAFDLETMSGLPIEIKSCAYLQSWKQNRLSTMVFGVPKTRKWESSTNVRSQDCVRQAKLYIFAVLYHLDKATLNPLDLDQWHFYLLPTKILNERTRSQHSITLKSLEALSNPTRYQNLRSAVEAMELSINVMEAPENTTL
jgi:hypothetical protein